MSAPVPSWQRHPPRAPPPPGGGHLPLAASAHEAPSPPVGGHLPGGDGNSLLASPHPASRPRLLREASPSGGLPPSAPPILAPPILSVTTPPLRLSPVFGDGHPPWVRRSLSGVAPPGGGDVHLAADAPLWVQQFPLGNTCHSGASLSWLRQIAHSVALPCDAQPSWGLPSHMPPSSGGFFCGAAPRLPSPRRPTPVGNRRCVGHSFLVADTPPWRRPLYPGGDILLLAATLAVPEAPSCRRPVFCRSGHLSLVVPEAPCRR